MPHIFCIINDLNLDVTPKVIVSAIISPIDEEPYSTRKKDYHVTITGFEDNVTLYDKVEQYILSDIVQELQIPENQITIHIY